MTHPVVFVDTETFGLDPERHPIWEVALITPDGAEHLWQIKWSKAVADLADPVALEIGRFKERFGTAEVISPRESAERVAELTQGQHLAGAVVSFDEERLRRMHNTCLGRPEGFYPWHYRLICVEAMMLGASRQNLTYPYDPSALAEGFGVTRDPATHHTALGDALWAKRVYEALSNG